MQQKALGTCTPISYSGLQYLPRVTTDQPLRGSFCLITTGQPGQEAGPALAPVILQATGREPKALGDTVLLGAAQLLPR